MPGIIPPGHPGGVGPTGDPAVSFANAVAAAIGFDPRVTYAQEQAEGHPGDLPGYNNWLNISASTAQSLGIPHGTGDGGIATFSSLNIGEQATIAEFRSQAIGLTNERGKTPAEQIADIAGSNWASSHYGGPGGPNLRADFVNLYGQAALGQTSSQPLPSAGGGKSGSQTQVPNPIAPITSALGSITDAFKFIFSYRFLEIVGGGLLILLGLYILARQFGATFPAPGPVAKAAGGLQDGTFQAPPGGGSSSSSSDDLAAARVRTETERGKAVRAQRRQRLESARTNRQTREKEYQRGYIEGKLDNG